MSNENEDQNQNIPRFDFVREKETFVELADTIATGNFVNGLACGWSNAAMHVMRMAGDAFTAGNDEQAKNLRYVANELAAKGREKDKHYRNHEALASTAALEEINRREAALHSTLTPSEAKE